jgi:hypothetical protein
MKNSNVNAKSETDLSSYKGRMLNHIEMVYRPGERHLAAKLFRTIGCDVREQGDFLRILIAPGNDDPLNNVLYASEVTPEQWQFEQRLQAALKGESEAATAYAGYDARFRREPQRTAHFGIRYPSHAKLEATLKHLESELSDTDLKGRAEVAAVFRPGDPGSYGHIMQAFLKTDILAAGIITLGQHIELQAQSIED